MKKKFKLEKNKRGYSISSVNNPTIKVAMEVLARKDLCKYCVDEVPVSVVALAMQCVKGSSSSR